MTPRGARRRLRERAGIWRKKKPLKSRRRWSGLRAMRRVELETGHEVLARISGESRTHFLRVPPGEVVRGELSPYDLTRGRTVDRLKG